jgi:hypothetical protein
LKAMIKVSLSLLLCVTLWSCGFAASDNKTSKADQQTQQADPSASEKAATEKAASQRVPIDPNKFAIILAGVGGEEAFSKKFMAQATQLYEALTNKLGFDEKKVWLLTETGVSNAENLAAGNFARATAEETRKALAAIKSAATPQSLVFVTFIGHGSFDNQEAKFNLVGPDIAAKEYNTLFTALPTHKVVVVNCASSSGEFIKPLSSGDRIVITATRSGSEQNITQFAEFFITALTDPTADADKNGRTSLYEAFNYATKRVADWYKQKNRLATEHALLDDNGDATGHEQAEGGDGAIAKTTYLDSKSAEEASADAEALSMIEVKQQLEVDIEKLKARKEKMKEEEYDAELERLLVELAKTNRKLKARKK